MTLGHFAPQGETGVADYARTLHRAMAARGPIRWADPNRTVALYHIGNNGLHREILAAAIARPGIILLHDALLHHLYLGGERAAYCDEFVHNYGEWHRGTAERLWRNRAMSASDAQYFSYPMLRRVAEASRLVLVHNPRAARRVREAAPAARVEIVPHLAEEPEADRDWLGPGVWFGVFGYLRPSKRLGPVLRAAARVPGARVLVSGTFLSEEYRRGLEGTSVARILGPCDEREFSRRLRSVDAVVSLRQPSASETSGITVRAMAAGKPVLLHSPGEADDFPEGLCAPVETGVAEAASLEAMMHWMAQSAADREAMGTAAAAYIRREHSLERVADRIWSLARALCVLAVFALGVSAYSPETVQIPMRDGVKLLAHVYRKDASPRFPVLLLRMRYGRTAQASAAAAGCLPSGPPHPVADPESARPGI